jgi:hypothetical protein
MSRTFADNSRRIWREIHEYFAKIYENFVGANLRVPPPLLM